MAEPGRCDVLRRNLRWCANGCAFGLRMLNVPLEASSMALLFGQTLDNTALFTDGLGIQNVYLGAAMARHPMHVVTCPSLCRFWSPPRYPILMRKLQALTTMSTTMRSLAR